MMSKALLTFLAAAQTVSAFPFVPQSDGVDSTLLNTGRVQSIVKRQQTPTSGPGSQAECPVNPNHQGAVKYNPKYPYNGAHDLIPGKGVGGFLVPDPKDTDHRFIEPDVTKDIRGPCPGLNAMANHGFLSRDGITTFTELVDAQQNVYNVGYDLAVLLAVLGLTTTDGDPITNRLSIGCDASPRTALLPGIQHQPGLDGHNKFEADTSLTRNDYFTAKQDNFNANATLFKMMTEETGGNYNLNNLAKYRYHRYQQSMAENRNFYFGPFSLLLFGAASFLYELMPSGTRNYAPDYYTISSFFGMEQTADGNYRFNNKERIPDNWTNRVDPYTIPKVGNQIFQMYALYPVLFGGNTGDGQFDFIQGNGISNGKLNATDPTSVSCLLYMLATERTQSSLNTFIEPTVEALSFALSKLNPGFKNLGCPQPLTK